MSRIILVLGLAAVGTLSLPHGAPAQTALPRSVMGNGGGAGVSPTRRLGATVGQWAAGIGTAPDGEHGAGFWYAARGWPTAAPDDAAALGGVARIGTIHPNPVGRVAFARLVVPERAHVRLALFDIAGRQVRSVLDRDLEAGIHLVPLSGENLSNGVYLCRLIAGPHRDSRRVVVLK